MKKLFAAAALSALILPASVQAQDWLGTHLETQRADNLRRHQQEMLSGKPGSRKQKSTTREISREYPRVSVNGRPLRGPGIPVEINGVTFVPMRGIFEALGAKVDYDAKKRLITASRGSAKAQLPLPGSSPQASSGFKPSERPFVDDGVTMVPLRMVSEKMGAQVRYDRGAKGRFIKVTDKK